MRLRVVEFKDFLLTYVQGCDWKWSGYRIAFCFTVEDDGKVSLYKSVRLMMWFLIC